jgi:hypothetical protein
MCIFRRLLTSESASNHNRRSGAQEGTRRKDFGQRFCEYPFAFYECLTSGLSVGQGRAIRGDQGRGASGGWLASDSRMLIEEPLIHSPGLLPGNFVS